MIESKSASSSANDVSTTHCTSGLRGAHLAAHLDAVAVGQPHVDDRDVGRGRRDARERLLGGAGLADDLDVVFDLEQLAHTAPDDLVIVEQEHPHRSSRAKATSAIGARRRCDDLRPAVPATSAAASPRAPIAARAPVTFTNDAAAATFGPIEPAANSPAATPGRVISPIGRASGVPQPSFDGRRRR